MNILELDSYNLADTVKFHDRLNPRLWDSDEHLRSEVKDKLMEVARDFQEFLGVPDLDVKDITISGSNAAYNYTPSSDIDLHIVIDIPDVGHDEVYRELFNAKKYQYNDEHDIRIRDADVELYAQDSKQPHHSQGIYSLLRNAWVSVPKRTKANIDDVSARSKFEDLAARIDSTIKTHNISRMDSLAAKIKAMRQSGLEQQGEFGSDNIAFKLLRNNGYIKRLQDARKSARDLALSLAELNKPKEPVVYGFMNESPDGVDPTTKMFLEEPVAESPDGVNPTTAMFLSEVDTESVAQEFIQHTADRLGIKHIPEIIIHHDEDWSEQNHSFGMYVPEHHELHVSLSNRHLLDVLRTTAHELCHCAQHESAPLPDNAGDTGSDWENEANAVAGIIMRDFANSHPEYFQQGAIKESASGYIPTKAQAKDPRYSMALTVDIKPGQVGREANKLNLKTDRQGRPALLMKTVNLQESLAREFELFEEQDLFEINMGSKNLRREAAKTGAIAGMEFEMIVPGMESEDPEQEPDYDQDQRCSSIEDAVRFFHDGDYNGRRDVERLRERMQNDFLEWRDDKLRDDWGSESEDYLRDWLRNNVNDDEWNPNELTGDERNELFDEFAANIDADPSSDYYNQAFDEWQEEFQDNYDESDWLDAEDLDRMSGVENAYEITWPHWTNMNSGEIDADQVADEFSRAVGREVRVNTRYHQSGDRPGPNNQFYIVEPDASLDGDNDGDEGLEFVSPPMPIDELLKDLNAVKAWAGRMGVYTNSSTGLHINISVPNYSVDRLDYVKLALLLGDEYVLNQFGRSSNTYTKSALGKVRDRVRSNPEDAQQLLDKMKGQMGDLASKAIHSGSTDKYTSINTKSGHIEFRSPGGDWLDDNFDKIENTLLRFTVAMSAALNPEAYREEYQKKLYKLLTQDQKGSDTIRYFADYVAGKIPKAALRSFIKQAQLQRNIKRGKTAGQKMWWKVYKEGKNASRYSYTVEVVATSEEEAKQKAAKEWGEPLLVNTLSRMDAEPVRPYEEKSGSGTHELYNKQTGEAVPDTEFSPRNTADQLTRLQDYVNHGQHGMSAQDAATVFSVRPAEGDDTASAFTAPPSSQGGRPNDPNGRYAIVPRSDPAVYGSSTGTAPDYQFRFNMSNPAEQAQGRYVLQAWAARNNVVPADYMVVDTDQWDRPADTGQTDVTPLRPTGPGPWEVANRNNNQVYYNTGHGVRSAAEAEARTWLSQNGYNPNDFEVRTRQTASNRDAAQNGIIDIEPDIEVVYPGSTAALAQQRATPGTFSGAWKVLVNGEEVHRFSGIGNNQGDANRVAAQWLRNNGRGVSGEGFEVVPIMTEGLTESNQLHLRDFVIAISPHALEQCYNRNIDATQVDKILKNIGQAKSSIMGQPDNAAFIIHDGQGTALGIRRLSGQNLKLATVYNVPEDFVKGRYPTFQVDTDQSLTESADEYELHDRPKLDRVLAKCCRMVVKGQQQDPERYGQVAACVIDPDNRMIYGINLPGKDGTRRHAERVAIDKYTKAHGDIPDGSIVVTTCSPCNSPMEERHGESCKDLLNSVGIHKVYAGYQDPTQHDDSDADFRVYVTENDQLWGECQLFAQTFLGVEELPENFADGRNPQDKGDSKRHGVPTKASVGTLRKVAKQGGRKGQLAHWMANMKAGKAKHNK